MICKFKPWPSKRSKSPFLSGGYTAFDTFNAFKDGIKKLPVDLVNSNPQINLQKYAGLLRTLQETLDVRTTQYFVKYNKNEFLWKLLELIRADTPPTRQPSQARIPTASRESAHDRHFWLVHHFCVDPLAKLKRPPWRHRRRTLFSNIWFDLRFPYMKGSDKAARISILRTMKK